MKISETSNQFSDFQRQKKIREKPDAAQAHAVPNRNKAEEAPFRAVFFSAAEARARQSLDELLQELQAQGERLARVQNFQELEKYRELVRQFMAKLVAKLYHLKTSQDLGSKVQIMLKKVNAELESLADMFQSGQAAQLRVLEKVDRIKGLLLDAYQ